MAKTEVVEKPNEGVEAPKANEVAAKEVTAEAKPVKSKKQIEEEADQARRAKVDATNKKKAAKAAEGEAALAKVPLNAEEKAFIARIAPKMNEGRAVMQPSSADVLRYSRLMKRKDVK
ncbi:hypothetical protein LCGC14_0400350 [marine sediment metagenome]|uniref:Uncharacterized protein n=1 Tax=marine sediment metagenome TaxID=412755 RepID=A0A0F9SX16_9ZZZZ